MSGAWLSEWSGEGENDGSATSNVTGVANLTLSCAARSIQDPALFDSPDSHRESRPWCTLCHHNTGRDPSQHAGDCTGGKVQEATDTLLRDSSSSRGTEPAAGHDISR